MVGSTSKEKLLQIVRDGAAVAKDKRKWEIEHIEAALCIIFGGAQYKAGTNLWGVQKKSMLRAPDFGLHLSEDRFGKIRVYGTGLRDLMGQGRNC